MTSPRKPHFIPALVIAFVLLSFSTSNLVFANIFGSTVAKLSYDIISVRNRPATIGQADVISPGADIPAGLILKTGNIPKDGFSGVLYDMGYACTTTFDSNNTLPTPDFFGLPRIALIRRGSPNEQSCTFRTKIQNAQANGAIAAIIYTYEGMDTINNATAALDSGESPLDIPGIMITYGDGMNLRSNLEQTISDGTHDFNNRVQITLSVVQKLPVVWEFVLIVVVVLFAVAFTVSVVLHCRLYALRQRIRMDALARGADVLPNGTIRMRKITLDKTILNDLPVRIFGHAPISSASTSESPVIIGAGVSISQKEETTSTQQGDRSEIVPIKENQPDHENTLTVRRSNSLSSLSRANSLKGSISGRSAKSLKAAAALITSTTKPAPTAQTANTAGGDMEEEACAVCLDEFSDGEEIRTLPCHHEFHCECIDPWLTRKSSLCPLCKYDCMPQTTEEAEGRGEDSNIVVPNDRLMEFIMGRDWVRSRTARGHNGSNYVDRFGHFFGTLYDRIRGRPPRPFPGPTVSSNSQRRAQQPTTNQAILLDENGQVPLQIITPHGVSAAAATEESTESTVEPNIVLTSIPAVAIDMAPNMEPSNSAPQESVAESSSTQSISEPSVAIGIPADEKKD